MRANDEMAIYLAGLLEHERACEMENCELCQSAHRVYRLARNLIFSGVVYPDVTIAARARVKEVGNSTSAARLPIPRAA